MKIIWKLHQFLSAWRWVGKKIFIACKYFSAQQHTRPYGHTSRNLRGKPRRSMLHPLLKCACKNVGLAFSAFGFRFSARTDLALQSQKNSRWFTTIGKQFLDARIDSITAR